MRIFRLLILLMAAVPEQAFAAIKAELMPKPNPPQSGDNTLEIKLQSEDGKPLDGAKLDLLVFMPAMGTMPRMEEKSTVEPKGNGTYLAHFELSMDGSWEMALQVTGGSETATLHYSVTTGIPGVESKGTASTKSDGATTPTQLMDLGPERLQKIGVRFAEAKIQPLTKVVESVGIVEQDQTHREEVTVRYNGYVVKQFVGRVGDSVKAGDALFSVYSPDLVSAQSELLLADSLSASGSGHSLPAAAAEKVKNMGLTDRDLAQIRKTKKPLRDFIIRAKVSGTVLDVALREGASIAAGQVAYLIGDLSKTYIVARVFQQDLGELRVGQRVEVLVPGGPTKPLAGKINLIYPQVEQGAGTGNVRVEVAEASAAIRPGIYAELRFLLELGNVLALPSEAILYSGRHRYVFVDHGNGSLEPREVSVGRVSSGFSEIRDGLKAGDRVAASGTFLLGSEAQLRSALPKWTSAEVAP